MKRVRGVSLEEVLRRLRAGDREAAARYTRHKLLTAFQHVCLALDLAHSRSVLHRDLKPGNIMLGDFGEVYLLDWGLAKVAAMDAIDAAAAPVALPELSGSQTLDGQMLGTPGYMAPEQVRGEVAELSPRSDVYALGAILFEILTLTPLHRGERVNALLVSTLQGADARASLRAPEAGVSPELEAQCVRATALARAERFPSARALHDALERYLDGDRDLELRRQLAARHAEVAAEAAARALAADAAGGEDEIRAQALREVGRALALDPQNGAAMRTFVRLLTEPPHRVPGGAREEITRSTLATTRLAALGSGVAYLAWMTLLPLLLWMGVRSFPLLALSWGLIAATGVIYLFAARRPSVPLGLAIAIVSSLGHGVGTRMFGPFFWVPGVAAMCSLAFAIQPVRRLRTFAVIATCLTFLLPAALEALGILPSSYEFHDGALIIRAQLFSFPRAPTLLFLALTSLSIVLTPFLFIGRIRDALYRAERRLHLQAWQLRQLVPDAGAPPSSPASPASK